MKGIGKGFISVLLLFLVPKVGSRKGIFSSLAYFPQELQVTVTLVDRTVAFQDSVYVADVKKRQTK